MSRITLIIDNSDSPAWLPSPDDIVIECQKHGHGPSAFKMHSPDNSETAFVKYGPSIAMSEARTQSYFASIVNKDEEISVLVPTVYRAFRHQGVGYIVMQYIDGQDCTIDDYKMIANAIKRLRLVENPTISPGPVDGGIIEHSFFCDYRASIPYKTVEELQLHVNNILKRVGYPESIRVNFSDEGEETLRACFDDIHPGNFRKDAAGQICVLDFDRTCFLPSSFQEMAFKDGCELSRKVGEHLDFPRSNNLLALRFASCALNLYNKSDYGLPNSLKQTEHIDFLA